MENIYVYLVKMPPGQSEAVLPCEDGYTIYLDKNLMGDDLIRAYDHAIFHIDNGDFYNESMTASQKEMRAHRLGCYRDILRKEG